ncbi:MAG: sugar porter family MFS transporter, partial [Saprospiraceae bacterium]|nr:sugar porter family MFS transporter [Saprospiraceae bacterium]
WGTVIGALLAGIPSERYGRRKTLIWIGVLFSLSAIGSAVAWDPYSFSFFRFIGGLGVGASSVAAPTYISEISTKENRGQLVILYQFNIVLGIFIAFFSNYLLKGFGGASDWRWMLGVEAIPAILYTLMVLGVPKSPRWLLVKRGDEKGARSVLMDMGIKDIEGAITAIKNSVINKAADSIWKPTYRTPVILAFVIAFFNQLSGINFILYYAPEILEKAGLAAKESLQNSIAIGGINLIFTFVGLYLIDRMGRKKLMLIGSVGYIIGLSMVAWSFYSGASPGFLLVFLLLFIAAHAVGQGAVIWVFISEIFPNSVRAFGQSWGSGTHWIFAAIITLLAPVFIDIFSANPWPIFAFFAGMMVLQLIWVIIYMPETKGVSLEELSKRLLR